MSATMINGRHIALGVTGGIAAYKSAALVSMLKKAGAHVHVCMTKNACEFITPLTFETLSGNRVITDTFSREVPYEVDHVALAKQAELVVVAPATANIIAKAANGIADDFLSTLLLAASCKVVFAPAMNTAMLHHPAVQKNLQRLGELGYEQIAPGAGLLACGDIGDGRMAEPEEIFSFIQRFFASAEDMKGVRVLVTAGPTREKIDDVRYLTNRSSGKMGYALAEAAVQRGASVTLVSGAGIPAPAGVAEFVPVVSAEEMYWACMQALPKMDMVIKAAAVADYTPRQKREGKLKKSGDFTLELVRTRDILQALGEQKNGQVLVGFAAEAVDLEKNALGKMQRKHLDMIAANDISRSDIGFGSEKNAVTLYFADGRKRELPLARKREIADEILTEALDILKNRS